MGVASVCCKEETDGTLKEFTHPKDSNNDIKSLIKDENTKLQNKYKGGKEKFVTNRKKTEDGTEDLESTEREQTNCTKLGNQVVVFVEKFICSYTLIDNFGLDFIPVLNIVLSGSNTPFEKTYECLNENDVTSNFGNAYMGTDEGTDGKQQDSDTKAEATTPGTGDVSTPSTYYFNAKALLNLDEFENWEYSRIRLVLSNKIKGQTSNLVIGHSYISLNYFTEKSFLEGKIEIFSKFTTIIGALYLRLKLEQGQPQINVNLDNQSNFSFAGGESAIPQNNHFSPITSEAKILYNYVIPFNNLSLLLAEAFEIKENEDDVSALNNQTPEIYSQVLLESISSGNDLYAYEILYLLYSKLNIDNNEFILRFFEKDQNFSAFYTLPIKTLKKKNYSLCKLFFVVLYKTITYVKRRDEANTNKDDLLDYQTALSVMFESFEILTSLLKTSKQEKTVNKEDSLFSDPEANNAVEISVLVFEEIEEINETIIWILNSITALTSFKIFESKPYKATGVKNYTTCYEIICNGLCLLTSYEHVLDNSEISSSICTVVRKCITEAMDQRSPKKEEMTKLLLFDEVRKFTGNSSYGESFNAPTLFIKMLEQNITKYFFYPEVFANTLLILVTLVKLENNNINRKVLDVIKLGDLCFYFEQYRWRLKNISKTINCIFYEYLANLTDTIRYNDLDSGLNMSELKKITLEINQVFKTKVKDEKYRFNKSLKKFLTKKSTSLQESFSKLAVNISSNAEGSLLLANDRSFFIPSIIEYLVFEVNLEKLKQHSSSSKQKSSSKEVEYSFYEIAKNSISCFNNLLSSSAATKAFFIQSLRLLRIKKSVLTKSIMNILEISNTFSESKKLQTYSTEFLKHIENLLK